MSKIINFTARYWSTICITFIFAVTLSMFIFIHYYHRKRMKRQNEKISISSSFLQKKTPSTWRLPNLLSSNVYVKGEHCLIFSGSNALFMKRILGQIEVCQEISCPEAIREAILEPLTCAVFTNET